MLTVRTMLTLNPEILEQSSPLFMPQHGVPAMPIPLRELVLHDCGDLAPVYDDPGFFKVCTDMWVQTSRPFWEGLARSYEHHYDPISNYDRTEEFEDTNEVVESGENSGNSRISESLQEDVNSSGSSSGTEERNGTTSTETSGENSETVNVTGSTENSVAGFNSSSLETSNGSNSTNEETRSGSNSATTNVDENGTINVNSSGTALTKKTNTGNSENKNSGSYNKNVKTTNRHSARVAGNIGVTTSQQMIMSERELWRDNIYRYIIEDFKQKFCVMVYY